MKKLLRWFSILAVVAGLAGLFGRPSYAQDFYAGKTIRIIVGFPAGGGFDTYSRVLGDISASTFPEIRPSSSTT